MHDGRGRHIEFPKMSKFPDLIDVCTKFWWELHHRLIKIYIICV